MSRPANLRDRLQEEILIRDVQVYSIPWGDPISLPKGQSVLVASSQSLHFKITVLNMHFYLKSQDSDAISRKRIPLPSDSYNQDTPLNLDILRQQLKYIYDPEIPVNIVDLGLIYNIDIVEEGNKTEILLKMTLTSATCGMGPLLIDSIKEALLLFSMVTKVNIELIFEPKWETSMMSDQARLILGLL